MTLFAQVLAWALLAVKPALEAGGASALGGQATLQAQDAQRRRPAVALVEQFPDPVGDGQLAAGVTPVPTPQTAAG